MDAAKEEGPGQGNPTLHLSSPDPTVQPPSLSPGKLPMSLPSQQPSMAPKCPREEAPGSQFYIQGPLGPSQFPIKHLILLQTTWALISRIPPSRCLSKTTLRLAGLCSMGLALSPALGWTLPRTWPGRGEPSVRNSGVGGWATPRGAHLLQLQLHSVLGSNVPECDLHIGAAGAGCGPLGPSRLDLLQGELHHQLLGGGIGSRRAWGWDSLTYRYPCPKGQIHRGHDTPIQVLIPQ